MHFQNPSRSNSRRSPKAATPQHVAENAGAAKVRLTDEEIARIEMAFPVERVPQALPML